MSIIREELRCQKVKNHEYAAKKRSNKKAIEGEPSIAIIQRGLFYLTWDSLCRHNIQLKQLLYLTRDLPCHRNITLAL